jgi:diguanylate cyclase (GGDEF)-like protein
VVVVVAAAVLACVGMVVGRLVAAHATIFWDVAWTASSFCAFAGLLTARQAATGVDRRRWGLWAAAGGCWFFGQLMWDLYGVIGFPVSPNLADVSWWAFAVLVTVSLIRSHARSRSARMVVMFETLPVTGAAAALSLAELWHDAAVSSLALAPKLSALVYPALFVAAAVVMLQAAIGGSLRGPRQLVSRLVLGGMGVQAVAFSMWSVKLLAGTYVPGTTVSDPLWVIGLLMLGLGGLLAGRRTAPSPDMDEPARHGAALPATMLVLLIAALIRAQLMDAPTAAIIILGAGLLFSGAALGARGWLLERRLRELLTRERATSAVLGEREAELARLNAQLKEDSRRDPLTGMRNRRALTDDLMELDAARGAGDGGFALALCDVDHFKAYNDRMGHLAGDQALRTIAGTVRGAMRSGDIAYRFGGEELVLILRNVGPEEALAAVERVRRAVEQMAMPHRDGVGEIVTVSIGVATGDEDSAALMARADAALYHAKHAGRNRSVVADDAEPATAAGHHHQLADEAVPRHLRSMLAVSRAAASGEGPLPVLESLAETIRSEMSFNVVAVNLLSEDRRELTCVTVLGDDDARHTLLDTVSPWEEWDPLMHSSHQRCGAIWLPSGTPLWERDTVIWKSPATAAPGADGWQPDDMLLLPLRGQSGDILGVVSIDQPVDGRRPDDSQIEFLMSVADHAGLGLEQSLRATAVSTPADEQSSELRLAAVMLLAETLDLRDPGTARHSRSVGVYSRRTAQALGLAPGRVERIHAAGVLHDLGKLGIADAILYKPGPLEDAEWTEMKRHPEIGARILVHAGLLDIAGWVRSHHERIDGGGYPDQRRAREIALEARILAVADAYEAMIADRPYRAGMDSEAARAELKRCSGTQFDPQVVAAFLDTLDAAEAVAAESAASRSAATEPAVSEPALAGAAGAL